MAAPATSTDLLGLLRKSGIHSDAALDQKLKQVADLPTDPTKCASALVRAGVVTPFQAKLLLSGRYRGFRIGPYVIREQVGQGGMGAVYKAEHETLRRTVAIKVLSQTETANKVAIERFLREARAAAALDHPNIVRIFDVGQQGDVYYLVLEYVEGQTLDQVIDRGGPMACGRAVEYIAQAAAGLQHAHEKGFVHRDIKPGNLMLTRDGTVKVLDMGLARSTDANDKLTEVLDKGAVVGTADYIAPEQAMNNPGLDIRADIYSLGATFFALVAGRPPFEGNTTQKLLQHQMKSAPSLVTIDKTFPQGLSEVVARMLDKKPENRYQTPAELIAAMAPWLGTGGKVLAGVSSTNLAKNGLETISQIVSGTTGRLPAVAPKKRAVWPYALAGAAALALVLAVGAVASGLLTGDPRPTVPTGPIAAASPPADATATPPQTPPADPAKTPPADPAKTPPKPPAPPPPLVAFDAGPLGFTTFALAGKTPADVTKFAADKPTGTPPVGWTFRGTKPDTAAAFAGEPTDGRPVLAARNTAGTGAAMSPPPLAVPSGKAKITVEYQTDAPSGAFAVTFAPAGGAAKPVGPLPATGGEWKTLTLDADLGGPAGTLSLVNDDPLAALRVRRLTVVDAAPPGGAKPLAQLTLAGQEAFVQAVTPDPGAKVPLKVVKNIGTGRLPTGWYRWVEHGGATAEYFAEVGPDGPCVGVRTVDGPPGVQLNSPEFSAPGKCRVLVAYSTGPAAADGPVLRFRPKEKSPIFDVAKLPPTGGAWRAVVEDVDLRGSSGGLFEVYHPAAGADAALRLRAFRVTAPDAAAAAAPKAVAVPPVYALDLSGVKTFAYTVRGKLVVQGSKKDALPANVVGDCYTRRGTDKTGAAAFRGEPGLLAWANVEDPPTGQLVVNVEKAAPLAGGQSYTVAVEYRTTGAGAGKLIVQGANYAALVEVPLPAAGEWRVGELPFDRPADEPVRVVVYNTASGDGNEMQVRKLTVAPAAKPAD